jgi:hypothetical protein
LNCIQIYISSVHLVSCFLGLLLGERRKIKESTPKASVEGSFVKLRRVSSSVSSDPSGELTSPLELLEDSQKELIEQLVTYQELFEIPTESDLIAFSVRL